MELLESNETPPADNLLDQHLARDVTAARMEKAPNYPIEIERILKRASRVYPDPSEAGPSRTDAMWDRLAARIDTQSNAAVPFAAKPQQAKKSWLVATRSLLATGLAIVIGLAMYQWGEGNASRVFPRQANTTHEITTRTGQQEKVRLPDGSMVVLAPGSTLRYASNFGTAVRSVYLTGEALFTVINDHSMPFIVQTENASVRVLGTTFVVRKYASDSTARVVVAQGKVAVATQVLTNGDAATITQSGTVHVMHGMDLSSALAWTTGTLVFEGVAFKHMIPELERWYGVRISVKDSTLLDRPLTMTFLTDAPDDAFQSIAALLHVTMTRNRSDVMLTNSNRAE